MRIVHVEDFFHPDAGYQINLLAKFMAKDGHEVVIITSEMNQIPEYLKKYFGADDIEKRDKQYQANYGVKIIRVPIYRYLSGRSIYNCHKIWNLIDGIKPDVLYIHGNDTYFAIRSFLRFNRFQYTIVTDSHMVDIASNNKFRNIFRSFYKRVIAPIIIRNKIPVIRTADDNYIEKRLGIPLSQAPFIPLGTDTDLFHPNSAARKAFREQQGIDNDSFVVLYAGKLDETKGGLLLAQLTCQSFTTEKEIVFVIVGNSIGEYGKLVEETFKKSKYKVLRFPTQRYTDLAIFYQSADMAIIPKQCTLSIFDYAATGLPVVAEDNEINRIRLDKLQADSVFIAGDILSFRDAVTEIINLTPEEYSAFSTNISTKAMAVFGFKKQYEKYISVINEAMALQ